MELDVLVIGSGPAGLEAAAEAARAGRRVGVVERERELGGACVHRGTIPSKTLRETAWRIRRNAQDLEPGTEIVALQGQLDRVVACHANNAEHRLRGLDIVRLHGRARFADARTVEVEGIRGQVTTVRCGTIVVASGSRPRCPAEIDVDHEHVLDSDSILSLIYLPRSLVVLGGGVIASEYATIFASLGVRVTMVDRFERPVGFLEPRLTDRFLASYRATGSDYLPGRRAASAAWDGAGGVVTTLDDGRTLHSDKVLVALGRIANLDGLRLERAGLAPSSRGYLEVNEDLRTAVPGIYAVGDVIGPPSLAATAMEQGRRAIRAALGLPEGPPSDLVPCGIYTIPEMGAVGLTEAQARARHGAAVVGEAGFDRISRAVIANAEDGALVLVAAPDGRLGGVHAEGDGATELVTIGQVALAAGWHVRAFVDHAFNYPTFAEAYRIAALEVLANLPEPVC